MAAHEPGTTETSGKGNIGGKFVEFIKAYVIVWPYWLHHREIQHSSSKSNQGHSGDLTCLTRRREARRREARRREARREA